MAVASLAHATRRLLVTTDEKYELGRTKLRDVHGERSLETIEALGDLGRMIIEVAYGTSTQGPDSAFVIARSPRSRSSLRWAARHSCRSTCGRRSPRD